MKGPYLEALPDYEKGRNLAELCQAGVLHADWMAMQGSPIWKRLLHIHQETALLHAAADDNYLVGTGTGSGKTEAFLYPMIDDILRDPDRARPGVRSVIVYPLNALANDQLYYRLAPLLLRELGDLGITFGRFTSAVGAGAERPQIEDQLRGNDALMAMRCSSTCCCCRAMRRCSPKPCCQRESREEPEHILGHLVVIRRGWAPRMAPGGRTHLRQAWPPQPEARWPSAVPRGRYGSEGPSARKCTVRNENTGRIPAISTW